MRNMVIKGLCSPLGLRRYLSRRKAVLFLICTVIVFIQMWEPLELHIGNRSNPLTKMFLWNYGNYSKSKVVQQGSGTSSNRPTDDFPFTYVINEPTYCNDRSDLYIINLVGTAPWEVKARNRIRRLWANETYRSLTGFSTIFILAQVSDDKMMEDVKEESSKFRDILLLDFMDSYNNLTLKTLALLHWVDNFCDTPTWVLKSDADVFVNPFFLSRYLHTFQNANKRWQNYLVCKRRGPATPCRKECPHAKWRVTYEEYAKNKYPAYCQGPGYLIPRGMVGSIYKAANKTHPFRMEDVYYTGILPEQIKKGRIKLHSISSRFPWRPKTWQDSFVLKDLMILELDKRIGRGASSLVWSNILKNKGLISEVNNTTLGFVTDE